jgi:hypothetical protein
VPIKHEAFDLGGKALSRFAEALVWFSRFGGCASIEIKGFYVHLVSRFF